MVTHVSKTLNSWILFCKIWIGTENLLLYRKLLKANSITSSSWLLFFHFKFSKVISLLYSSWLLVIYFPEIYISILTSIIEISTCDLFHNNSILTQSIIFLPVLSKYALTRITNIFPIQKKRSNDSNICISIQFLQHFFEK